MNIALDLGQHLGYVLFEDFKLLDFGVLNLPSAALKAKTLMGRRYEIMRRLLEKQTLQVCYYEMTDWHLPAPPKEPRMVQLIREKKNRVVQRGLGRLEMAVEAACIELGLRAVAVKVSEAKRALTGIPNAPKARVAKAVREAFPYLPAAATQDALDAVSVAVYAMSLADPLWRMKIKGE